MGSQDEQPKTEYQGRNGFLLAGQWTVLPRENKVVGPGFDGRIADKFMQVLVCLIENPGVVTRDEIMDRVWPDTVVVDEVLTRAISELRKLFADDPRSPRVIETIPKRGYRLLVKATPLAPELAPEPEEAPSARASGTAKRPLMTQARILGLLGLSVAAIASVAFWLAVRQVPQETDPAPRLLQLTSLSGVEEYPCLTPTGDRILFAWEGDDQTPTGVFVKTVGQDEPLALTPPQGHYAYPAWSHDTRHVAYSRVAGTGIGLYQVSATGGSEELLVGPRHGRPPLMAEYSPDGKSLAYAAPTGIHEGWRLEEIDLATRETRVMTEPSGAGHYDRRPRYSPDGRTLAFLRWADQGLEIGLLDLEGGKIRRLDVGERFPIDLDWTAEGKEIVFTADDGVWLVSLDDGRRRLVSADHGVSCVGVASQRRLLAYTQARRDWGIWEVPLDPADPARTSGQPGPLMAGSFTSGQPSLAPDGSQLAFISRRSGEEGLWLTDRHGKKGRILVRSGSLFAPPPAWSPHGDRLAFQLVQEGNSGLGIIPISGGQVEVISSPDHHDTRPFWSRDGQHLYFSRVVNGLANLWTWPTSGGPARQVTTAGGWRGEESFDGRHILFTRARLDTTGIWSLPVTGGTPRLKVPVPAGELVSWTAGQGGIYLCTHMNSEDRDYTVWFQPDDGAEPSVIITLQSRQNPGLAFDPSGPSLIYSRIERLECDLVGIENF